MTSPYHVLQPYIWVALAAFVLGFVGFVALGGGATALARETAEPAVMPVSGPQHYPGAGPVRIA